MSSWPTSRAEPARPGLLVGLVALLVAVAVVAAVRGPDRSSPAAPSGELALVDPDAPVSEPTAAADPPAAPGATSGPAPTPTPAPTATVVPTPTPIPLEASGTFTYAQELRDPIGAAPGRRYAVATEDGSGVDPDELAGLVAAVLEDPRSWIADGATGFQQVGADDDPQFTVVVATPATVDRLCAPLRTVGKYSCGNNGWIAINLLRWVTATETWPADVEVYRQYLVNHEVGHYILGPVHEECPGPGALAPIMQQQTIDLAGCRPNPWPYPDD